MRLVRGRLRAGILGRRMICCGSMRGTSRTRRNRRGRWGAGPSELRMSRAINSATARLHARGSGRVRTDTRTKQERRVVLFTAWRAAILHRAGSCPVRSLYNFAVSASKFIGVQRDPFLHLEVMVRGRSYPKPKTLLLHLRDPNLLDDAVSVAKKCAGLRWAPACAPAPVGRAQFAA